MKKVSYLFIFLLILSAGIFLTAKSTLALSTSDRLKGKILLQVESKGETWYVSPADGKRHSMGRPADAFNLMRQLGIGISNDNLEKIKIANENLTGQDSDGDGLSDMVEDSIGTNKNNKDSDGDGYSDKDEILGWYDPSGSGKLSLDNNFARSQAGKILLQVEKHGEAWYISPDNYQRYFLGRPGDAFNLMRKLGLGITNNDLNKITSAGLATSVSCVDKIKFGKFVEGVKKYYSIWPAFNVSDVESGCNIWYVGTYATEVPPYDWYYDNIIVKNGIEVTDRQSKVEISSIRIINGQPVYITHTSGQNGDNVVWKGANGVIYDKIFGFPTDDRIGVIDDKPVYVAFKARAADPNEKISGDAEEYQGDTIVVWGNKEVAKLTDKVIITPEHVLNKEIDFSDNTVSFLAYDFNNLQQIYENTNGKFNNSYIDQYIINVRTGEITSKKIDSGSMTTSCDSPDGYDETKKCYVTSNSDDKEIVKYKSNTWGPYEYVQDIIVKNGKLTYTAATKDGVALFIEGKQISDDTISVWGFEEVGGDIAYFGNKKGTKNIIVVYKGIKSREYEPKDGASIPISIYLYDVRGKLVYKVSDKTGAFIVFDGVEQKHYSEITKEGMLGSRFYYIVSELRQGGFSSIAYMVYEENE